MTDATYTHITILADRTGSMGEAADPGGNKTKADLTTQGIHNLIRDQAAQPGRTTFSLVQFDAHGTDQVTWFAGEDAIDREWAIVPRGATNLLDATGETITRTGEYLAALPEEERPGRVYFVIGTDGLENASREYTKQQVAGLIASHRNDYSWEFVFIGADIDAFAEAGGMGIPGAATVNSAGANLKMSYSYTSDAITRSRAGGQSVSYTAEERKGAAKSS